MTAKPLLRLASGGASRSRTDLHGFAIRCITALLSRRACAATVAKRKDAFAQKWSGRRVSNSRPIPWQGIALPTELLPHGASAHYKDLELAVNDFSTIRVLTVALTQVNPQGDRLARQAFVARIVIVTIGTLQQAHHRWAAPAAPGRAGCICAQRARLRGEALLAFDENRINLLQCTYRLVP
jgi:hypothetical protein